MEFAENPMQNAPKNLVGADRIHLSSAVTSTMNDDGSILSGEDIVNTIPRFPTGWKPVDYIEKREVHSTTYNNVDFDENGNANYELQAETENHLETFRHAFPTGVITDYLDSTTGQQVHLWEAYDIVYNPDWKHLVAKYMGGLCTTEIGIFRLLRELPNDSTNYLSMYMFNDTFSKLFQKLRRQEREKIELAEERLKNGTLTKQEYDQLIHPDPIEVKYNENYCNQLGGVYAATVHAFRYAFELNDRHPFCIIEQIYDNRNGGKNKEVMSKYDPKAEVHEEYNIFNMPGYSESVFTNMKPQIFKCEFKKGDFIISRNRNY